MFEHKLNNIKIILQYDNKLSSIMERADCQGNLNLVCITITYKFMDIRGEEYDIFLAIYKIRWLTTFYYKQPTCNFVNTG